MPKRGPLLVVSNHQSLLDPVIIGLLFPAMRVPTFMARIGLFQNRAFGALIRFLNAIPIRQDESDMTAIRAALERLERGEVVVLFPEGARTRDGRIHSFKRGAGLLMKRARCPVIAVGVEGAFDAWPRTQRRPRLFAQRIHAAVGHPIPHDELLQGGMEAGLAGLEDEVESLRRLAATRLAATGGAARAMGVNRGTRAPAPQPEAS